MMEIEGNNSEIVENLANYTHNAWSGWMKYLFSKSKKNEDGSTVIPASLVERWERQMSTVYSELPENEKESDREEARQILILRKGKETEMLKRIAQLEYDPCENCKYTTNACFCYLSDCKDEINKHSEEKND